jgi:hypothetical protein
MNTLGLMRNTSVVMVLVTGLLLGTPIWGQDTSDGRWPKRLWKASIAAVAAGSVADITSSLGKHETNGILANRQGTFSAQGISLKLAIVGGSFVTQHYLLRKQNGATAYKTGALINFAVAGTLAGVAAHNYGNSPVRQ